MTARKLVGPSPSGGGPTPSPRDRALEAATRAAEELDLPITMQQLDALLDAVSPYLADLPRPRNGEVDAAPTVRLLHSLITAGWTVSYIAERMRMGQPEVSYLLQRQQVTVAMAARVERVFLELYDLDPIATGVHPRGVTRARNQGAAMGWEVVPASEVAVMRARLLNAA